jgi:hypothetical protein
MNGPQYPDRSFRIGKISVGIWRHEKDNNGRMEIQHSVKIEKTYLPKGASEYVPTNTFFVNELADLEDAARIARQLVRVRGLSDITAEEVFPHRTET